MEIITTHTVGLNNLRIYAFHGVYPEEAMTGHWFRIDLQVDVAVRANPESDDLSSTLNYGDLQEICRTEMAIRADLLETVCSRIITQIRQRHPISGEVKIRLTKEHPAFIGGCSAVFVEFLSLPEEL